MIVPYGILAKRNVSGQLYSFTFVLARIIMLYVRRHLLHEFLLHCPLAATQCIVICPVCGWVGGWVRGWVCYYDNSKLRASILTNWVCR